MGEITIIVRVVVNVFLCFNMCYSTCYDGFDEEAEVIYGQGVNLRCNSTLTCNVKIWANSTNGGFLSFPTNETVAEVSGRLTMGLSEIRIHRTTFYEEAVYTCWCHRNEDIHNLGYVLRICSVSITTICLAKVLLNGETIIYYSNNQSSTNGSVLQVTEYDNVMIECQKEAYLQSNCPFRIDTKRGLTNVTIETTSSCHMSCIITENIRVSSKSCVVYIFVQVVKLSSSEQPTLTSTATAQFERTEVFSETGTSWPVLLVFIGVVCLLFLVVVALSTYIFFIRANTRLTSKEISRSVQLSPGTNSEEPISYEDIDGGTVTNVTVTGQDVSNKCGSLKAYYTVITNDSEETEKHNQTSTGEDASYSHTIY